MASDIDATTDTCANEIEFFDVLNAMNLLVDLWDSISGKTIKKFFKHTGFKSKYDGKSGDCDQSYDKIEPSGGMTEG